MDDKLKTATKKHKGFYDYDNVDFRTLKSTDVVAICCPVHGVFNQRWNDHISGCGCSACGSIRQSTKSSKSIEYYKTICSNKHGGYYDYSLWINPIKRHSTVQIICPTHGQFKQLLNSHISGSGCRACAIEIKANNKRNGLCHYTNQASAIHNNKYDYSLWLSNIKTIDTVQIICPKHGQFKQLLNSHLMGRGCNDCKSEQSKKTCELKYGVPHILQKNMPPASLLLVNDASWLIDQHVAKQKPLSQIASELGISPSVLGHRLKKFNITTRYYFQSAAEVDISQTLQALFPSLIISTNDRSVISGELDIYLPEHNIAIEYNGLYWHSEKHKDTNYHLNKTKLCEASGIRLIHIFQDEWAHDRQKCIDTIIHLLGHSAKGSYARHLTIREISWNVARDFLDKYHLLNAGHSGNYRIGAFNDQNDLIGVMVFGQQNNERSGVGSVELRRFVTNKRNNPGLGSKMFKYAVRQQGYNKIVAFVDRRWFTGLVKNHIGFTVVGETSPAVWWTDGTNRFHRRFKTKQQLIQANPKCVGMTKSAILDLLGYYRIYDSGKLKLMWVTD